MLTTGTNSSYPSLHAKWCENSSFSTLPDMCSLEPSSDPYQPVAAVDPQTIAEMVYAQSSNLGFGLGVGFRNIFGSLPTIYPA